MTFKGMLKILINDYRKQHEEKMFSVVEELMKTRRELNQVREQLNCLQSRNPSFDSNDSESNGTSPGIDLFVQYNGFFNQLCHFRQTIPINDLLNRLRRLAGIPVDHAIHLRVLSEDGSTSLFYLDDDPQLSLESFGECLKPRMIISIEDCNDVCHGERCLSVAPTEPKYYFDQSDV